eukprot:CAMPEP_0170177920 /NCGR_PEP_ID=MMETSP0040_2-20121228/11390_1 /TAXON_ID=641309 /ORGANISM="Lotharella oceanica, Strain CCMP622" /LENGTH=195 /DNA_ID=CAMNT_0010420795 /DNA_START=124 /DNA_END=711 /DNA_ORIENTATION=+
MAVAILILPTPKEGVGLSVKLPGVGLGSVSGVRGSSRANLRETRHSYHHPHRRGQNMRGYRRCEASHRALAASEAAGGANGARIEFIDGVAEQAIPEIRLTRSRDGLSGVASFKFQSPKVLVDNPGEISGMNMVDDEGVLSTIDIEAMFQGGNPMYIEAKYVMKSPDDWDRFMRFMDRYSKANDLGFEPASPMRD